MSMADHTMHSPHRGWLSSSLRRCQLMLVFPTAAHTAFLLSSPLPLTTVTLPYALGAWSLSKRSMMNIVNMLILLKEINDSRRYGAALIAQQKGCEQNVLHENWDIINKYICIYICVSSTWKVSPEENMIFVAVEKAFWVVLAVSSLEVAYLRTEHQWWIHNTDICLILPPFAHFPVAAELTGWHRHKVWQRLLMLPAHWRHVDQLTYSSHWQNFTTRQAV